jgi:hypothetical protein
MVRSAYRIDPQDPRAPTTEEWAALSDAERANIVAQLPSEPPTDTVPEGDRHRIPKEKAVQALSEFFTRIKRRVYLSAELPVYYPGERWFAPDLIAVLDVEGGFRDKWVVSAEGKGLDLALEVTLAGDRRKDLVGNVDRYARLGIREYFVLDLLNHRIVGYRLEGNANTYTPIVPQSGRWESHVLGLDLMLEEGRIRFFMGSAPLLEADELIGRLSKMVDELVTKEQELAKALEAEQQRADHAEQRAGAEQQRADQATQRVARLEARLRELGIEPDD